LQVGDGKAKLGWEAVEGAWNYTVKRSKTPGGPYAEVASGVGINSFEDQGLLNGTTYYYVVSASNLGGAGANSAEIAAVPMASPSNLAAVGGMEKVELTWSVLNGATNYTVKRSTVSGGPYETVHQTQTPSYTDSGLVSGHTYYYVVQASLSSGVESGFSLESAGTTMPSAPALSVEAFAATALRVKWNSTNLTVTEYLIEQSSDGSAFTDIGKAPGNASSFEIGGLSANTTYYFRARARNNTGLSPFSETASGKTPVWGVNVNFANSAFTTGVAGYPIPGYFDDYGDVFMDHDSGYSFGWLEDNTANSRYRNSELSPDGRYDTLNHLQKNGGDMVWEIAVTNGIYAVHIAAGDPTAVDSMFQFSVEDQTTEAKAAATGSYWAEFNQNCTVSDGLLTIRSGPQASNNKICFIDIYKAPSEPPSITSITLKDNQITVQWSGGGTLQSATSLSPSTTWTDAGVGGTVSESVVGAAKFYRIRR
jgi:fibronectin type 3 domain-containing protein